MTAAGSCRWPTVYVMPLATLEEAVESVGVWLTFVSGEPELIGGLPYGHGDIVAKAVQWLRAVYTEAPTLVRWWKTRSRRRICGSRIRWWRARR